MSLADVDYITKNNGWLYVNMQKVGYLSDGVKIGVKRTVDTYKAMTTPGGALVPIKKVTEEEVVSISAGMAVISAHNLARALGQKAVSDIVSASVTVATGDNDLRTVLRDNTTGKLYLYLGAGPGLGHTFAATSIKKGSTALVLYPTGSYEATLDATTGMLTFESGGVNTIAEGDTIDCEAYTYTRSKGQRIDFGASSAIVDALIHFVHKEPNGKVETHAVLWKGACNGDFELEFGGNWVKQDAVWEGNADETNHPTNPVGYIFQRDLS